MKNTTVLRAPFHKRSRFLRHLATEKHENAESQGNLLSSSCVSNDCEAFAGTMDAYQSTKCDAPNSPLANGFHEGRFAYPDASHAMLPKGGQTDRLNTPPFYPFKSKKDFLLYTLVHNARSK